jgi:hypothetical protein
MSNQQKKNQLLILAIFAMSIIPFLIAWGLKENPAILKGGVNNGQLITPAVTTERTDFIGFDRFSAENMAELPGHWLLVNIIAQEKCSEVCLDALLKTKQIRLMLNKELPRTRRIVILLKAVDEAAASQWWLKDSLLWRLRQTKNSADDALYTQLTREENKLDEALVSRLIGAENRPFALKSDLIKVKPSEALVKKITDISKGMIPEGTLLLMDPLGNLMMRYAPGFDPYKVKSDLMHLLRISQIG